MPNLKHVRWMIPQKETPSFGGRRAGDAISNVVDSIIVRKESECQVNVSPARGNK